MSSVVERFSAYGHPDVSATHKTTFEITAEEHLTPAGSCIIAVRSEKGAVDLSQEFRIQLQKPGSHLITTLTCGHVTITIKSSGSPALVLDHTTDMVWRRSSFTCGRTIGIFCDHTAAILPREMITLLRERERLDVVLTVIPDPFPSDRRAGSIYPSFIFPNSD